MPMAEQLNRFWERPGHLSPAPGERRERKEGRGTLHFLGAIGMRQLQAGQKSGVSRVFH